MDDLIEREPIEDYLRRKAKWVEPEFDIVEQHRLLEAADRIAALEALVKEAGEALSEYACHGGPDLPCIRSKDQCRTECGKIAGDALAKIKENTNG